MSEANDQDTIRESIYLGSGDERIAPEGEVWLRDATTGEDVDLTPFEGELPHGTFAPVNTARGIEMDDELEVFASDFEAARAIADFLGARTGRTFEIWYDADE